MQPINQQRNAGTLESLTAGRVLTRNAIWNIVGECAPLLVAAFAIPLLIHALGTARFGILMIVWLLIGYLSVFDLGMGRALTNLVAQKLATGEEESLPPLIWTANTLMLVVGIAGAILLAAASHWLVYSALKIPAPLKPESLTSLYILSCALPAVISASGFRGVLEAYQRFDAANAVRIPMGAFSFAGPLAVLPFSHSLVPVVIVLAAGRYAGAISYFVAGRVLLPVMRSAPHWQSTAVRPLLSFGGWITVSNLAGPILAGIDRFFLAAIVSMQAVAFYATPYEIVTKLIVVPIAIAGVLFPAFSASLPGNAAHAQRLYRRAQVMLALVMTPIILLIILAARPGLRVWLGSDFASHSSQVLRLLSAGVLINVLSYIPSAVIQGAGRPDWTAKLHAAEVPVYLAALWLLTVRFGMLGTASAWVFRVTLETLVVVFMTEKVLRRCLRGKMAKQQGAEPLPTDS